MPAIRVRVSYGGDLRYSFDNEIVTLSCNTGLAGGRETEARLSVTFYMSADEAELLAAELIRVATEAREKLATARVRELAEREAVERDEAVKP